jgi:hypothetical protein
MTKSKDNRTQLGGWLHPTASFFAKHKMVVYAVSTVLSFAVGSLFGSGVLFQWASLKLETARAEQERTTLDATLISQLFEYESGIHKLVPEYVERRNQFTQAEVRNQDLEYQAMRYELTSRFVSYNKLEAKLSQLEHRGAQFILPAQFIPPLPPRIVLVDPIGDPRAAKTEIVNGVANVQVMAQTDVLIQLEPQPDDVDVDVTKQLVLIFDQYDESFRDAYYSGICKGGDGRFCTALGRLRAKIAGQDLNSDIRALYEKGCSLKDSVGCEIVAFDAFQHGDYFLSEQWLIKACDLSSGNGCGFLGSLYASKLLGAHQNMKQARANLSKGCDLLSDRSCYYLAILLVSGLIDRDEKEARSRLELACKLKLGAACSGLQRFKDFAACSSDAIESIGGEGVSFALECKPPEKN